MENSIVMQLLFIFILVGINAFFAASEIAVISLNENKVKKMAEEGNKTAQRLFKLIKEPSKFLATIQVGITLAGFLASASAAQSFSDKLAGALKWTGIPLSDSIIYTISFTIIVVILSYITLVLGELVPKRLAMQKAERISMLSVVPLDIISKITSPFIRLLTLSTNFIVKIFGGTPYGNDNKITEEEIRLMVDVGEEKGIIRETEKEMIDNIFEFDDTQVSRIMTHRTSIVALNIAAGLDEVLDVVVSEQFSRIPVYEEDIDNIVGILYAKDLFQLLRTQSTKKFNLRELVRKPFFVPISKKTDELFKDLQLSKNHMAIVIDEYGGTAGLVTIEDLIEEIVGNIFDEYDEEEKEIEKIDENTFILNGSINLEKVNEFLEVELPVNDYETLSGFIIGQIGRIPGDDERPVVEYENLVFKVEEVIEKRITRVKVCKV